MRFPRLPNYRSLLQLALPLSGVMASQAVVNMIDTAVVGHLGGLALAAVGIGSYLVFILMALPVGFAIGIQSILSNHGGHSASLRLAENKRQKFDRLLASSYVISITLAILLLFVGYYSSPLLLNYFVLDDRLTGVAQSYFDWRLWALPGVAVSLIIRSFWVSQQRPWQYSRILFIAHGLNIPISYVLIYGWGSLPAFGPVGAGMGTCASIYIGLLLQLYGLKGTGHKVDFGSIRRTFFDLWLLLKSSLPSGAQQLALAIHLVVFLWMIGHLGISPLAASFAVLNVGLLLLLPIVGLAQASSTLVAQCWQKKPKFAYLWSIKAASCGLVIGLCSFAIIYYSAEGIFAWVFINPDLITLAALALPIYTLALAFDSLSLIATRSLIATQRANKAMLINIAALWLVFLPVTWFITSHYGYIAVWWWQLGFRLLLGIMLWWVWHRHFLSRSHKL